MSNLPEPRKEDTDLLLQQDKHQFEIAKLSIQTKIQDNREFREHMDRNNNNGKIISLCLIAAVFIFGMFALYLGKEQFLSDVLKVIIGAFCGAGIGYMFGKRNNK